MRLLIVFPLVVALQGVSAFPPERTPDLRYILSNDAALRSVEVVYSVEGLATVVRGDGTVLKQSTRQQVPLLPTCKGTVTARDVRQLVEMMLTAHLLDLPRKSYMLLNEDWRTLQLHSISIDASGGSAKRDFSAGEYVGKRQELPQSFVQVEKAIIELEAKAISLIFRPVAEFSLEACNAVEERFPRIWVADAENRDLRQLL